MSILLSKVSLQDDLDRTRSITMKEKRGTSPTIVKALHRIRIMKIIGLDYVDLAAHRGTLAFMTYFLRGLEGCATIEEG